MKENLLYKLIDNFKKTMLVDEANIKSVLFAMGFILFCYQHMLFSMIAQKPFFFVSDFLLLLLNPIFSWAILFILILLTLCSIYNKKIAKCLLQMIRFDVLLMMVLFPFLNISNKSSYSIPYSILKTTFFEDSQRERMIHFYEIFKSVFQYFPVKLINLVESEKAEKSSDINIRRAKNRL